MAPGCHLVTSHSLGYPAGLLVFHPSLLMMTVCTPILILASVFRRIIELHSLGYSVPLPSFISGMSFPSFFLRAWQRGGGWGGLESDRSGFEADFYHSELCAFQQVTSSLSPCFSLIKWGQEFHLPHQVMEKMK